MFRKIKNVFKKSSSKEADDADAAAAAPEPTPSAPPTYDALMEARQNDEANVCMPKDDIRDEEDMGIVEDVTDMEEHLSVVEEATSKQEEEQDEQEEVEDVVEDTQAAEAEEIVALSTPAEMKVVEEEPVKMSSPFMCGITNCLGRD